MKLELNSSIDALNNFFVELVSGFQILHDYPQFF